MAEFSLPKNSKIQKGRHFAASGAKQPRVFKGLPLEPGRRRQPRVDSTKSIWLRAVRWFWTR